jgi:hypothetical protein
LLVKISAFILEVKSLRASPAELFFGWLGCVNFMRVSIVLASWYLVACWIFILLSSHGSHCYLCWAGGMAIEAFRVMSYASLLSGSLSDCRGCLGERPLISGFLLAPGKSVVYRCSIAWCHIHWICLRANDLIYCPWTELGHGMAWRREAE